MEIAYIPCLAYPAGEMNMDRLLCWKKAAVVVIAPNDSLKEKFQVSKNVVPVVPIILIHEKVIRLLKRRISRFLYPLRIRVYTHAYRLAFAIDCVQTALASIVMWTAHEISRNQ